jgi:hypothetical protein
MREVGTRPSGTLLGSFAGERLRKRDSRALSASGLISQSFSVVQLRLSASARERLRNGIYWEISKISQGELSPEATEVDGLDALLAVDHEIPALPVEDDLRPPLAPLLEGRDLLDHGVSKSCIVNSNQVRFTQNLAVELTVGDGGTK